MFVRFCREVSALLGLVQCRIYVSYRFDVFLILMTSECNYFSPNAFKAVVSSTCCKLQPCCLHIIFVMVLLLLLFSFNEDIANCIHHNTESEFVRAVCWGALQGADPAAAIGSYPAPLTHSPHNITLSL